MPNSQGNPAFQSQSKYGESTKVIRLPHSLADAIALLLHSGVSSHDIFQKLQSLTEESIVPTLKETDTTLVSVPMEYSLLRAIKDIAKEQNIHHTQWIINQCKKSLTLPADLTESQRQQIESLIDQRFSLLEQQFSAKFALSPNEPQPQVELAIALPDHFPPAGLSSTDLGKIFGFNPNTINAHRRKGNGLLAGWIHKQIPPYQGFRYFPSSREALDRWLSASSTTTPKKKRRSKRSRR
jgi:hypothetical protein